MYQFAYFIPRLNSPSTLTDMRAIVTYVFELAGALHISELETKNRATEEPKQQYKRSMFHF